MSILADEITYILFFINNIYVTFTVLTYNTYNNNNTLFKVSYVFSTVVLIGNTINK